MLPGGVWRGGEHRRDYALAPLTGAVEMAIAMASRGSAPVPRRVTEVLAVALSEIGGAPAGRREAAALAVADRQFLMRRLAVALGLEETWLALPCDRCGELCELPVRHGELPVKPAGEGYPFAVVETRHGLLRFRVPTGEDQEAISGITDAWEACLTLVHRCLVEGSEPSPGLSAEFPLDFSEDDVRRVEAALEQVAPEVTTEAEVACALCGERLRVHLDPYLCLARGGGDLFAEIHTLASVYHWSERQILHLPRDRRQLYLSLIDRERGIVE